MFILSIFFPLILNNAISPGHFMSNNHPYESNGGTVRSIQCETCKKMKWSSDGRTATVDTHRYTFSTPWDVNTAEIIK